MSSYFNNFVYAVVLSFLFASVMSFNRNTTFENTTSTTFNSTGLECDVCQFVAQEAEGLLLTNKTLTQIETDLDSLCQKTKYDTLCESVVNTYLPKIIEFLEQEETPQQVCQQVGVC
jgi:hypothetical protein